MLFATEGARALFDYSTFLLSKPILQRLGQGDGHPVLVLPGFLTGDKTTRQLRGFIDKIGYQSYPWKLGRNYGNPQLVDGCVERLLQIYESTQQKVSIVGWSLGGVFAREVARRQPDLVRQVITLGSPFAGAHKKNNVSWLYSLINGRHLKEVDPKLLEDMLHPPPVPTTAIFTKGDGIVHWEHCIEQVECDWVQNIEVKGSHCGLGVNPSALLCITNRLAQCPNNWEPFRPGWFKQFFYPNLSLG